MFHLQKFEQFKDFQCCWKYRVQARIRYCFTCCAYLTYNTEVLPTYPITELQNPLEGVPLVERPLTNMTHTKSEESSDPFEANGPDFNKEDGSKEKSQDVSEHKEEEKEIVPVVVETLGNQETSRAFLVAEASKPFVNKVRDF